MKKHSLFFLMSLFSVLFFFLKSEREASTAWAGGCLGRERASYKELKEDKKDSPKNHRHLEPAFRNLETFLRHLEDKLRRAPVEDLTLQKSLGLSTITVKHKDTSVLTFTFLDQEHLIGAAQKEVGKTVCPVLKLADLCPLSESTSPLKTFLDDVESDLNAMKIAAKYPKTLYYKTDGINRHTFLLLEAQYIKALKIELSALKLGRSVHS